MQSESELIRSEILCLCESAPENLQDLLGDIGLGGMNGEISKEVENGDEVSLRSIILASTKAILGLYDEEDLEDDFRHIGVQRPGKWAKKMMQYIAIRRGV